jgi:hypothetical protein
MSDPKPSSIGISPQAMSANWASWRWSSAALALTLVITAPAAAGAVNSERCRNLLYELLRVQGELNQVSDETPSDAKEIPGYETSADKPAPPEKKLSEMETEPGAGGAGGATRGGAEAGGGGGGGLTWPPAPGVPIGGLAGSSSGGTPAAQLSPAPTRAQREAP